MNKKAVSIPIVLLVFATVVLCVFALFSFHLKNKDQSAGIENSRFLEDAYAREAVVDFQINEILSGIKASDESGFLSAFKERLGKYKDKNGNYVVPEFSQVEAQIQKGYIEKNKNVKVDVQGKKIEITFTIEIGKNAGIFSGNYAYEKTFEYNFV